MAITNDRIIVGQKTHDHICDECNEMLVEGCTGDCDFTVAELCDACEEEEELENDESPQDEPRT